MAARNGVGLTTVLRRCVASHTLFLHFMEKEAGQDDRLQHGALTELRSVQAALLDRLVSALSEEHGRGEEDCSSTSQTVLAERVRRLLAAEFVDTSEIPYNFEAHHIGLVAKGAGAAAAVQRLATAFDSRLLSLTTHSDIIWAWLGARDEIDRDQLGRFLAAAWPSTTPLALGETSKGPPGWRLTHLQAKAAFFVSLERQGSVISQYADVALLASMGRDDLLSSSLRDLYLKPLMAERDGGAVLRSTLRAYFHAGRNGASAAASLGISRQTVSNHLQAVERLVGKPLNNCAWELEAALRLNEMDAIHK